MKRDRLPQPIAAPGVHDAALGLVRKYVRPNGQIADLCAGQGAFALRLLRAGYSVAAADIRGEGFSVPEVPFYAVNLQEPFADKLGFGSYDCVTVLEGIEHLENPWAFLRECRRLVTPKGILVLSTPNVECVLSRLVFLLRGGLLTFDRTMTNPSHITPIFSWILTHALERAGFRLVETVFTSTGWAAGHNWKFWLASKAQWLVYPFIWEAALGEIRVIVAEAVET